MRALSIFVVAIAMASLPSLSGASEELYDLKYRFRPGEEIRWTVTQLTAVDSKIEEEAGTSRSRSESTKLWTVTHSGDADKIMFIHSVEDADMWQHVSGRAEISFDSRADETPPPEYAGVSSELGVPLVTVTMDARGKVLGRREHRPGISQAHRQAMVIPLPRKPIAIGDQWSSARELPVTDQRGVTKRIQTRRRYTLESVKNGLARIKVEHQVLSPVHDPSVEAQLVQDAAEGVIKFDIDTGRLVSQRLELDKRVVAFQGPASSMRYVGRFEETLLPPAKKTAKVRSGNPIVKTASAR